MTSIEELPKGRQERVKSIQNYLMNPLKNKYLIK